MVEEGSDVRKKPALGIRQISGQISGPLAIRRSRDSGNHDCSRLQVAHEKHEISCQSLRGDDFIREEIRRCNRAPVSPEKCCPARSPRRRRVDSGLNQDSLDRRTPDQKFTDCGAHP